LLQVTSADRWFALRGKLRAVWKSILLQGSTDQFNTCPESRFIWWFQRRRCRNAGIERNGRRCFRADPSLALRLSAIGEVAALACSRPPLHLPGLKHSRV
jgi:hypothetical protein